MWYLVKSVPGIKLVVTSCASAVPNARSATTTPTPTFVIPLRICCSIGCLPLLTRSSVIRESNLWPYSGTEFQASHVEFGLGPSLAVPLKHGYRCRGHQKERLG